MRIIPSKASSESGMLHMPRIRNGISSIDSKMLFLYQFVFPKIKKLHHEHLSSYVQPNKILEQSKWTSLHLAQILHATNPRAIAICLVVLMTSLAVLRPSQFLRKWNA